MSDKTRQSLIAIAVLVTLAVNGLANALPINGVTTGEVSDSFDTLFVPAGYAFSIWGLIYLGLIAYAIYQAFPSQRANPRLQAIAIPFLIASAANPVWIFLWHYRLFTLTLVAMVTLLLSLITVYRRLRPENGLVPAGERWLVRLPFSIYLGWISVATIANAQDVLYWWGWDGFGISDVTWAVTMLMAGLALAGLMAWRERDPAFVLVFVWAYIGIGVAQAETPAVATAANASVVVLVLVAGAAVWFRSRARARAVVA